MVDTIDHPLRAAEQRRRTLTTTAPNAEVKPVHPKAMPVILTEPDEWAAWMDGLPATELQRPLRDGALQLVEDSQ